ncbi:hypothetical protein F2P81_006694 [Scophthalmus maximus]|uniref:E3 ubiquitin-protein ligase synoviolin-like TPR repeats domain-containing protein n=1 Tax=Scophthalmus maximus TaxID=52904 RepID=A0A6A4T003_SCOMX|nr:hypothetical protein F2P81_006694 [Scophthalmus maximus]
MPLLLLERFPWPSLQTYTALSAALLVGTVLTLCSPSSSSSRPLSSPEEGEQVEGEEIRSLPMHSSRISRWVMVNSACCVLLLVAKLIQRVVFGPLRVSEKQQLKEKFWNFLFYKFIFVFGVLNVQTLEELSFSPATPLSGHARVLLLLVMLLSCCAGLAALCSRLARSQGRHTAAFMAAECMLVTIRTTHVMFRYSIHLWDVNQAGGWEKKSSCVYYTDLLMELLSLGLDLLHHTHMLVSGFILEAFIIAQLFSNIWLSMASLVVFMQLRFLLLEVQKRTRRHRNYLRVLHNMETRFPVATTDELSANNDDCAICWDAMSAARKLPCGHLFHSCSTELKARGKRSDDETDR